MGNIKKSWPRELWYYLVLTLERHDLPGAWRVRSLFESFRFDSGKSGAVLCSTEHGVYVAVEPFHDTGVESSIFRTGTYERGTLAVIEAVLRPGDYFVDIGANVGLMSLVARKAVGPTGKVDSYEPLPEIQRLLRGSIEANSFTNIFIHDVALGSEPATMTIHRHVEVNRGSASLAWGGSENDTLDVVIKKLDDAFSVTDSQPITMIKIDVEGWELEVLKGAMNVLARIPQPVLCIEFSNLHPLQGGTPADMMELLVNIGYLPYRLTKSKSTPSALKAIGKEDLPEHDNLFFFPSSRLASFAPELFEKD